ncbi:hypothetical protein EC973_000978 [Apophysomyces ossiformis]|uniref:Protein kinase domain-containing protein n=1 Tax=Apophysomyces ossiformis TaxID=679940 RepID=A0A8H7BKE1_9FUNG|nr:hypothetical protein EC973_000978 [Apophysomyces ossiformis]
MTPFTEYEDKVFREYVLNKKLLVEVEEDPSIDNFHTRFKHWTKSPAGQLYIRSLEQTINSRSTRSKVKNGEALLTTKSEPVIEITSEKATRPTMSTIVRSKKRRRNSEMPETETVYLTKTNGRRTPFKMQNRPSAPKKQKKETPRQKRKTPPAKATQGSNDFKEEQEDDTISTVEKKAKSNSERKQPKSLNDMLTREIAQHFPIRFMVEDFRFERSKLLGEGHIGKVMYATYRGVPIACKCRRLLKSRRTFYEHIKRELMFAAKLSVCRFANPYLGVFECKPHQLRFSSSAKDTAGPVITSTSRAHHSDIYIVQRYYEYGDLRDLMEKRASKFFHPIEILQLAISLSAALADAHQLGIGIVDLKWIQVDLVGSLILGRKRVNKHDKDGMLLIQLEISSCVELEGKEQLKLSEMGVPWTKDVAAPEMIRHGLFTKKSDIFMAMLIVAEMMTPSLSDKEFQERVLSRTSNGSVEFRPDGLNPIYKSFFPILRTGLHPDAKMRPDALYLLQYFEDMRHISLANMFPLQEGLSVQTDTVSAPSKTSRTMEENSLLCDSSPLSSASLSDFEEDNNTETTPMTEESDIQLPIKE